ncbi:YdeI/OmpD-associated family protein [Ulvibacter antarcticus]|uniref:Uncharacterized protein YdeI (YjbR/CyaY-like superfamily) n=1 Tax=Ulvibacter antarcticus TaxID=442714 RepID=A0A3L9YVL9_9FLAO|nr:DUF1801 domain-containing protein [Ulvibacter antarcticus]RMA64716.1 uncharacterized protein YdeI (YjbR/CyaY-like superfamily) [Ulvibacter antarcticus]
MSDKKKIDSYIKKHSLWTEELMLLRTLFNASELIEEVKWGAPAYTLNGKNVAGLAAFKNYMGIWFHQGVFLKDKTNKLVNAQEGITKAMRQWRFGKGDAIDAQLVTAYINEAIENSRAGKEVKVERKTGVVLSTELKNALKEDVSFNEAFKKLTPGKQREYAQHIDEAKREATKLSRLEKIIPMILEGQGLHDRYKNC